MGNTIFRVGRRCPETGIDCDGIGAQGGEKSLFTNEERLLMKERLFSSPGGGSVMSLVTRTSPGSGNSSRGG